jgi:hypothetical protein
VESVHENLHLPKHLSKGRGERVVRRLKRDRWTSPERQGRSKVSIVAEHVEFAPRFKQGDGKGDSAEDGTAEADGGTVRLHARLEPGEQIREDLLAVGLVENLVARAFIELRGDVLETVRLVPSYQRFQIL